MPYKTLKVKELSDGVVLIQLHRPTKLNSLSNTLTTELFEELQRLDRSPNQYGCAIITGSPKVFCAGADIAELSTKSQSDDNAIKWATDLATIKIPIIAAVSGFCLGGGLELAMLCDIMYASKLAKFGQPEIKIGVIPGGGGTQRLAKAIGKSNATEIILTGDQFSADQAAQWGLVTKIFEDHDNLVKGAIKTARKISSGPRKATVSAKLAIKQSYNLPLNGEGMEFERKEFAQLLSSKDKEEGMKAFLKRRKPVWEWKRQSKL